MRIVKRTEARGSSRASEAYAGGLPWNIDAASPEHERRNRAAMMNALHTVARVLRLAETRDQALPMLLHEALAAVGTDAGAIWLHRPDQDDLQVAVARGWFRLFQDSPLKPGDGIIGTVFASGRRYTTTFADDRHHRPSAVPHVPVGWAGVCVPIRTSSATVGTLAVCVPAPRRINAEHVTLIEALAEMAGATLHRLQLRDETVQQVGRLDELRRDLAVAYDTTIAGWSRALDLRDNDTEGHTQRVAEMTVRLARAVGIGDADLVHVRRGALLHDIGKICVPDRILLKPGPLTDEEWTIMRLHPKVAYDMLLPISHLRQALDIPYCHHEKWDGTGYPRGLKGTDIPLAARVFAVVDVWDALRSDRPYRAAWSAGQALEHIQSLAGTHFDPDVVRVFLDDRTFESPRVV